MVIIALLLAIAAGFALGERAGEEADAAATPVVARVVERAPVPAAQNIAAPNIEPSPEATAPQLGSFQEGFCAPEGDETIRITRALGTLIKAELLRRQENDSAPEETALMRQSFEPFEAATHQRLLREAQRYADAHPGSVMTQLVIAQLGKALALPEVEIAALRRARQALPRDAAIGLALALATRTTADLDEAIAGLGDYLAVENAPGLARMRARLEVQRDIQRPFSRRSKSGITLLWPPEAMTERQADGLLSTIDTALEDASRLLGTQRRTSLTVVVYPGRSELLAVSCVPTWAGGLFDGVLRLIASSDALGVKPRTVLHETLHAQLTPFAPNAPKWFHEGVAQSFAKESNEVTAQWSLMVRNRVWVPFDSLDGTFGIFAAADAHLAYAQSLAMVEYLRDVCGSHALADAAAALQAGANTQSAMAKACNRAEVPGGELLDYLERRLRENAALP